MEEFDEFTKYQYSVGYYKNDNEAVKNDWLRVGNYFRNIFNTPTK